MAERLRQRHLAARVKTAVLACWRAPGVRETIPVVLATRSAVLVAGFLAIALVGYRPDVPVPWRIHENELWNLPARWDTQWYMDIVTNGYEWEPARASEQQNIAFFPLYPMLMRYASLGVEPVWTGVAIAWLSFFGALVYLYRLARDRFGDDAARAGIALLASYPFAFFYSTAYTESLFLLTMAGACYHFERQQFWRSGLWGLAAGLTRPNGCLLSIVLGLMSLPALRRSRDGGFKSAVAHLGAAAAPGGGMLVYALYVYLLTGHPFQWVVQNAAWGRVYRGLGTLVGQHLQLLDDRGFYLYVMTRPVDVIHVIAVLFMLATVWPVARRLGMPYAVLVLANVIAPLLMGGLLSMGRLTSVLFPPFLWLGAALPPRHRAVCVIAFAILQGLLAAVFFTWRPLY